MSEPNLFEKFPEMRPMTGAPALSTINGVGFGMYGTRDHDEETGTYVKTHCFCFFFIPIFAFRAYRVADGQRGWYFLGRVPLSSAARTWNIVLLFSLLSVAGGLMWHSHTHSEKYIARQQLEEGDHLAEAGQLGKAARLYQTVAVGNTEHAPAAVEKIGGLLGDPATKAAPAEAAEAFKVAIELRELRADLYPNLLERADAVVSQHEQGNPRGAVLVLQAIAPAATDKDGLLARQQLLLEKLVAAEPGDSVAATELAVVYEARGQLSKCEKLLVPHRAQLGFGEGTRILGLVYAQQGKLDDACALLAPYTEHHLKELHDAEQNYHETDKSVREAYVQELNSNKAQGFDYQAAKRASKDQREEMGGVWLSEKLRTDAKIKAAVERYRKSAAVVPVALDFGVILLRRAQAQQDPEGRKADLERAEKAFLAIQGKGGKDQQEHLSLRLGQVYYWLGKHAEGRKQFDELLKAQGRAYDTLVQVAILLREVGATTEARALVEEAYNNAADPEKKQQAASLRSVITIDLDDKILWLSRANPSDPSVKASLSWARGNKAMQEGKDAEAVKHLREAIELYEGLPASPGPLNNCALAYFSLYHVTGEREAIDKGVEKIEKALALEPRDSVLLANAANSVLESATRDLIGSSLDLKLLKAEGSLSLLAYLYQDKAGRDRFVERVRKHAGIARATAYYDRLLILAPKRPAAYHSLSSLHEFTGDTEALRNLQKRLETAELDLADSKRQALDYYVGKEDAKREPELKAALERNEAILKAARKGPRGATFAVAACKVVDHQIVMEMFGLDVDPKGMVNLAEEALAAAPSAGTNAALVNVLLLRGSRAVAGQDADYADLVKKARRSLSPSYRIAVALGQPGKLRDTVLANEDVKQAIALQRETNAKLKDEGGPWVWAMFSASEEDAGKAAQAIAKNEAGRLGRQIDLSLTPYDGHRAYNVFWAALSAGDDKPGRAALKRCQDLGVPLPSLPAK